MSEHVTEEQIQTFLSVVVKHGGGRVRGSRISNVLEALGWPEKKVKRVLLRCVELGYLRIDNTNAENN